MNILKNYSDNIYLQINKIYTYAISKDSNDYSNNTRNKIKNIYGKEIFKQNPINGIGVTGIYRTSRVTKIGIENEINTDAKNLYWTILGQEGIIGYFIYYIFFQFIFYFIRKKYF